MRNFKKVLLALLVTGLVAGCATVGQPFAEHKVANIVIGETSRSEIQTMFGKPWRTGLESGQQTWTYGHYHYSAFGADRTSDLILRFNKESKVAGYSFNRTTAEPAKDEAGQVAP